MTLLGTVNSRVYNDTDFNATDYANRFQTLIGDAFDHLVYKYGATATGSVTIGTGSKVFNISNNLSSVATALAPGMYVYCRPSGTVGGVRNYMTNYMAGVVTAVSTNAVTVNVLVAHGSGTFGTYYVSLAGDLITSLTSPLPITQGGSNATTQSAARTNLGFGDPSSTMEPFLEDFCGAFSFDGVSEYTGEQVRVTTVNNFDLTYDATTNPASGGVFYPNYSAYIAGDRVPLNYDPRAIRAPSTLNTLASHPGICGLSAPIPGAFTTMLGRGIFLKNNIEFPFTGDLMEFEFQMPSSKGFNADNTGGFCIGVTLGSLNGYALLFNVGNADACPFSVLSTPYGSDLIPAGYMAASVITWDVGVTAAQLWTDNVSQLTWLTLKEDTWYKVRMTRTDVRIYQNGTTLVKTISGYTAPTMAVGKGSRYFARITKNGGAQEVTAAVDYLYHRHTVSR